MTVGEIDFGDTFIDTIGKNSTSTNNPLNPFPEASFIFISFFLLLMTISLMNLLVGSKTRVVFYPGGTLKKFGFPEQLPGLWPKSNYKIKTFYITYP